MKREEKEVKTTIFNKITVTEEEQKFLAELVNAIKDLCEENDEVWRDNYLCKEILKILKNSGNSVLFYAK